MSGSPPSRLCGSLEYASQIYTRPEIFIVEQVKCQEVYFKEQTSA